MKSVSTVLLLLVAVGCSGDDPVGVDTDLPTFSRSGAVMMVPFKGVITQTSDALPARRGPSYDLGCVDTAAAGAVGEVWIPAATTYGTATATHLGRATLIQDGCIEISNVAVGGPFLAVGDATLTAANGDEVSYTFDGFVHQGSLVADVDVIITGGTGRFAGASGGFSASSTGNSLAFPVIYPFEGTISAPH